MINVNTQWICDALGGELHSSNSGHGIVDVLNVSTDTRTIQPGDLFVALRGNNFDGHKFINEAVNKGAVAVLVDHITDNEVPSIVVADTTAALGLLGAAVKAQVNPITVAITGSVGKTTVKEMVASVLSRLGKVLYTQGNFNNEIGVPLTLLRLEHDHEYAVMELGANHPGEIAYTTGLVKPNVAMINNVAAAHLEGFIDLHGVARAKGEIFTHSSNDCTAVVNCDSEFAPQWLRRMDDKRKVARFAMHYIEGISVWVEAVKLDRFGCAAFELCHRDQNGQIERVAVKLQSPGKHNVNNALAAATCCLNMGASLQDIAQGLGQMTPVHGRVNLLKLSDQLTVIDDTYNANVESAKAAIDLLRDNEGLRLFIFGDMAELGCDARQYHQEVGRYAKQCKIDRMLTLGVLSQNASEVFNGNGKHFSARDVLLAKVGELLQQSRQNNNKITILVKGSRSAKMELVVQDIVAWHNSREAQAC